MKFFICFYLEIHKVALNIYILDLLLNKGWSTAVILFYAHTLSHLLPFSLTVHIHSAKRPLSS